MGRCMKQVENHCCRSFYVKLAFFSVFVFALQIDFAARDCIFVFLQMTLPLNKLAHPWHTVSTNVAKTLNWKRECDVVV